MRSSHHRQFHLLRSKFYFKALLDFDAIKFEVVLFKCDQFNHEFYEGSFDLNILEEDAMGIKLAKIIKNNFQTGSMFRMRLDPPQVHLRYESRKHQRKVYKKKLSLIRKKAEPADLMQAVSLQHGMKIQKIEQSNRKRFKTLYNKYYYIKQKIKTLAKSTQKEEKKIEKKVKKHQEQIQSSESSSSEDQFLHKKSKNIMQEENYSDDQFESMQKQSKSLFEGMETQLSLKMNKKSTNKKIRPSSPLKNSFKRQNPIEKVNFFIPTENSSHFNIKNKTAKLTKQNGWRQIVLDFPIQVKKLTHDIEFVWKIKQLTRGKMYIGFVDSFSKNSKSSVGTNNSISYGGSSKVVRFGEEQEKFGEGIKVNDIVKVRIDTKYKVVEWQINGVVNANHILGDFCNKKIFPFVQLYFCNDQFELVE